MMKFACNSPYLFKSSGKAYMAAFLSALANISIELTNLMVVFCTKSPLNIVSNFVALVIISQFDEFMFASNQSESFKKMLEEKFWEKVIIVSHTTSKKCSKDL
jgi:hypothetical protein